MKETGTVMREVSTKNVSIIVCSFPIGCAPPSIALFDKNIFLFASVSVEKDLTATYAKVDPQAVKTKFNEEQVEALRHSAFYLDYSRIVGFNELDVDNPTDAAKLGKRIFMKKGHNPAFGFKYEFVRSE